MPVSLAIRKRLEPPTAQPKPEAVLRAAKMFFGALDEMATSWILSRRRRSLESDADHVVDLFLNGARAR